MTPHSLILAGGAGTRLWPLSRRLAPKQFLHVGQNPHSLIQSTALRLTRLSKPESMFTITHQDHAHATQAAFAQLGPDYSHLNQNILTEPLAQNTLPAIGWATMLIAKQSPDAIISVFPSDQIISDENAFETSWKTAIAAAQENHIVLFGITPTRPATEYGYIKTKTTGTGVYQVEAFVEKPDAETAKAYVASGQYFWNAGMFVFKASVFLRELETLAPEVNALCQKLVATSSTHADKTLYAQMPNLSIDYGFMEKCTHLKCVPANMGWSDVGSWQAYFDVLLKDANGNATMGNTCSVASQNNLIVANSKATVATYGVANLAIVQTADATLVCPLDQSANLKQLVDQIRTDQPKLVDEAATTHRPWGQFTILHEERELKLKKISVHPGETLSLQMHHHRSEHWIVIKGTATVTVDETKTTYRSNQYVYIPKESKHRLANEGSETLEIIELQVGDYLGEDDIVRFEDKYKRI